MHASGVVDLIYLGQKNHDYSISAQSYAFCSHLIKLDIIDFTPSHILPYNSILPWDNFLPGLHPVIGLYSVLGPGLSLGVKFNSGRTQKTQFLCYFGLTTLQNRRVTFSNWNFFFCKKWCIGTHICQYSVFFFKSKKN